tara:strand:- start:227 stop:811 length:585 start_codon:yes stop_codon:yes gene_type:complete
MTNYQNGKIYKITGGGLTYYGSTIQTLAKRMAEHQSKKNYHIRGCTSSQLIDSTDCKIELVEDYPCNSKVELERREGWHQLNNECINLVIAGRTMKEYRQTIQYKENKKKYSDSMSEVNKEKRLNNIEKYKEKDRVYYQANKEKYKEKQREHYNANKEKCKKRERDRYNANKEYRSQYDKWRNSPLGILARSYF